MRRRYVTADVFTERAFGGNPLAVVLDAEGLSSAQMQAIATEFNYSETTFVLPPRDGAHTARVRIFTATREVPFAGHPNVGTAVVLALTREAAGAAPADAFVFEEAAGPVSVRLIRRTGEVVGAEIDAPVPLAIGPSIGAEEAGACLALAPEEIRSDMHPPQILSVGLPFLVVEVGSREVLRRCRPVLAAHERILPPIGTDAIFVYARGEVDGHLHARVFAPLDACIEDPATGSAAAATIARLTALDARGDGERRWRIEQGVDMGRPSVILGRTVVRGGAIGAVCVAGHALPIMQGTLQID